jgi:hypothetical protein
MKLPSMRYKPKNLKEVYKMKRKKWIMISLVLTLCFILVACGSSETQVSGSSASDTPAIVDGVSIDFRNAHYYALITGTYPDACTRISEVEQDVSGNTITIVLSTAKPEDLMCAQMLSPFGIDLLIATGGLLPGEYTLDVNGATATFTLGE